MNTDQKIDICEPSIRSSINKKALKNPHIQDRKLRSMDINELIKVREELKKDKIKK